MKGGRDVEVDLLHENSFKFLVYFLLVFSICKMLFISFLYLNCCKIFEVLFNPRMIIIIIIIIIAIICTVSLVPPTLRVWQFFVEIFLACTVHQTYIFRFAVLVTKYVTQVFSWYWDSSTSSQVSNWNGVALEIYLDQSRVQWPQEGWNCESLACVVVT